MGLAVDVIRRAVTNRSSKPRTAGKRRTVVGPFDEIKLAEPAAHVPLHRALSDEQPSVRYQRRPQRVLLTRGKASEMPYLLDWATTGTEVLVGLRDPLPSIGDTAVVPGRVGLDSGGRSVVVFTPPGGKSPEAVDAALLGDSWASHRRLRSGEGWAISVFAAGSIGHLRWQIMDAQRRLERLVTGGPLRDPTVATEMAATARELSQLVRRAALIAEPAFTRTAA